MTKNLSCCRKAKKKQRIWINARTGKTTFCGWQRLENDKINNDETAKRERNVLL